MNGEITPPSEGPDDSDKRLPPDPPAGELPPVDPRSYRIIKHSLLENRYVILGLTLFLQVALAVPILRLKWYAARPKLENSAVFQQVKIKPPEQPPPDQPTGIMGGNTGLQPQMSAAAPRIIATISNPLHIDVTMAAPKVDNAAYDNAFSNLDALKSNQAGTGDLYGIAIDKNETLVAVLDESGSMEGYIKELKKELDDQFSNNLLVPSCSARGQFDQRAPGEKIDPQMYDLYEAARAGIEQQPQTTAVYIMTDFEDGEIPADTEAFVALLREKHIKLFIRSVERPAYKGLIDYAAESYGQYICEKPEVKKP